MNARQRLWPRGWRPDRRTLGLLIFGFFGVSAITALWYTGYDLSQALNLQTPGQVSFVPGSERLTGGVTLVGGVADLVAAFGGLALMADLARARVITASAIAVAGAALLLSLVVSPIGFPASAIAAVILDAAVAVLVIGWQPRGASAQPRVALESSGADGAGAPIT